MAAIPKFAPILIVDGAVREVSDSTYTDPETAQVRDNGRKVILLTAQGFIEVKVSPDIDFRTLQIVNGDRFIAFVELSEWAVNGKTGSTLKFVSLVTPEHLAEMGAAVSPKPAKAS